MNPARPQLDLDLTENLPKKSVRKSAVSVQNNGFGGLPSSRIDSHRNFESIGIFHVDFRPFPTHFMPKSTGNRPEHPGGGPFLVSLGCQMTRPAWVGDHFWCPQGARRPGRPGWGTIFGVLRVLDDSTAPGGGPFLVSLGCQMTRQLKKIKKSYFFSCRKKS